MSKPNRVEYDIGQDRYQRRVRLVGDREGGQMFWTIRSEPVSQRDDGEICRSLTADQFIRAAEIMQQEKRNG